MTTRFLTTTIAIAAALAAPFPSMGQDYPAKRINIATSGAGGAGDFTARLIGQGLTAAARQPVIIENRPTIAPEYVAKSPPDGYTLLLYGNTVWISPLLRPVRWDALKDFSPVMLTVRSPNVLVVTPTLPVKSVRDLIALAKARPGEMNYASSALGSSTHLAGELFTYMAGVNIVRVHYKGVSMGITDVISGQVQVMFLSPGAVTALIKSGKLRALAVTGTEPSALFPGLPTVAASGVPGYESSAYFGLFAPAKTPAAIIARINQEVARALNAPDAKSRFFNAGMEVVASSPETFAAMMKSEIAKWSKILKKVGLSK